MGKKKSSIGCLFWVALILLVLVIFLFNRKTIESVLDRTGLLDYIAKERTIESTEQSEEDKPILRILRKSPDVTPEKIVDSEKELPDEPVSEEPEVVVQEPVVEELIEEVQEPETPQKLRKSRLYFVYFDGAESISLKTIVRPVYYTDSPLTDTISSLLTGLSPGEISDGLLSLVPEGTQLLGVSVQSDTAYINFNESFRFNAFGRDGYRSQLQQIIYTATEFQTVHFVQILVNGKRISHLGPESPFTGEPLSRESL